MDNLKKYQVISNWIQKQIDSQELKHGDILLPEQAIAKKFNVCRQTVRQALQPLENQGILIRRRGSGTIINLHPDNKNKIIKSADKYTFSAKSKTVGIITPNIDTFFFPKILNSIHEVLLANGYDMSIKVTRFDVESEEKCIEDFLKADVCGLIVESSQTARPNNTIELYQKIKEENFPCVFFNTKQPDLDLPLVSMDENACATLATTELIKNGHKKIAGIFKSDNQQGLLRYQAFIRTLKLANLPVDKESVLWYDSSNISTIFNETNCDNIIKRFSKYTGIVCYCDEIAITVANLFESRGYSIPEDISLVGFDNLGLKTSQNKKITSVKLEPEKIGSAAADALLALLQSKNFDVSRRIRPSIANHHSVKKLDI